MNEDTTQTNEQTTQNRSTQANAAHVNKRRGLIAVLTFAALAVAGWLVMGSATAEARSGLFGKRPPCHKNGPPPGPEEMRERAMTMTDRALDRVDATDSQRDVIVGIVERSLGDIDKFRSSAAPGAKHGPHRFRQQVIDGLLKGEPDKNELESLRADAVQHFDGVSKILLTGFAEIADVLTPDQRQTLADQMEKHGPFGRR